MLYHFFCCIVICFQRLSDWCYFLPQHELFPSIPAMINKSHRSENKKTIKFYKKKKKDLKRKEKEMKRSAHIHRHTQYTHTYTSNRKNTRIESIYIIHTRYMKCYMVMWSLVDKTAERFTVFLRKTNGF